MRATLIDEFFEVTCCEDVDDLLHNILKAPPDIIILSARFGRSDGYAVAKKIKLNPKFAAIPLILTAATGQEVNWGCAITSLIDDIKVFPREKSQLISSVRHHYRQKRDIDTLKTHVQTKETSGFHDVGIELGNGFKGRGRITVVSNSETARLTLPKSFAVQHRLATACTIADITTNTDLIILDDTKQHLKLLADLKSDPRALEIPILCLWKDLRKKHSKRSRELGAADCLPCEVGVDQLATRIQSLINAYRYRNELQNHMRSLVKDASFDPLTGLFNRRHAENYLASAFDETKIKPTSLAALMLDVDDFKSVNDRYGHHAGDQVLKELANRLSKNLRKMDLLARIGGEEFLVVIPDTNKMRTTEIAERLRGLIEEQPFVLSTKKLSLNITVSIGIACRTVEHETADHLLDCADRALYRAKSSGRNCIHLHAA
ncbi:diguanylate cyclase [Amylibacter marinus]|uniref:diguanylate cyclase n=1 Tax=Amylibacter marinus TaxID=1475483 RepID=UPI0024E06686|nr:diguanylate cyclase [Amylibacter marinus]